jgi:LemA protein
MRASGNSARLEAEMQLGNTINSVLAAAERYPDLKASQHFLQLRTELADSEDRLAGARRYFNLCVEEYNATLRQFPGSFVGAKMQLGKRHLYDLGVERVLLDEPVAVSFS